DQDNAVGSTRTIDGRCIGIFEEGERLDIVRIDQAERIGTAIAAATGQWHAIDDDERVVAGIERRPGTDTDGAPRSRPATIGRDLYAGSFPRNQLFRRGDGPFLEILGGYGGHGTGQLPFTLGTVADDDHFFQAFR